MPAYPHLFRPLELPGALLEYLSRWFDVGMRKKLSCRLFNFQAVRKHGAKTTPGRS